MSESQKRPSWEAAIEALDDEPASPKVGDTIGDIIARRYNRRDIVKGALGITAATAVFAPAALAAGESKCEFVPAGFSFDEVEFGVDGDIHVAEGYDARVLLKWGDHLHKQPDDAPFLPLEQLAADQKERFGYNNDYIAYFPINGSSEHGLLCINHEYANGEMMFPGVTEYQQGPKFETVTNEMVGVQIAAVGVTVVEVQKNGESWEPVYTSPYNRRITADTLMTFDGPVEEHADRFAPVSSDDACGKTPKWDGRTICGTLANCAGGSTPWGTYLTAEENIHYVFWTERQYPDGKPVLEGKHESHPRNYERYKIPEMGHAWGRVHDRFNVDKEPNEPNRFGWIVEIDPFNPDSAPVKHTALGRFFHEGAELVLSNDDRAVVYSGDDAKNEYVFRFVSKNKYIKDDAHKEHNMRLLADGTLSVARFNEDGTGVWLPLIFGQGALTAEDSDGLFKSQADVVINARLAADAVDATKMDRPEDVQPNAQTKRVYVMLTNNDKRAADKVDAANPRPDNSFGHIIEMVPDGGDFAAEEFSWDIVVRCGNPGDQNAGAAWNAATSDNNWFVCPDNASVDDQGRLWIATDQGRKWQKTSGRADGLYALETHGIRRGTPLMFFRVPIGAELCGPCFTPNGETLFVAVQHPGTDGTKGHRKADAYSGNPDYDNSKSATFENPATRWPDFDKGMPPRPSVVAITKKGGGKIGGG